MGVECILEEGKNNNNNNDKYVMRLPFVGCCKRRPA